MNTPAYQRLRDAMIAGKPVSLHYKGHTREVCAHVLGTKNGLPQVLTYQYGGGSSSGLPNGGEWRCLMVGNISDVEIIDGPWHTDEVTKLVNGGNGGWDPMDNRNGRGPCPDNYCGYSPNQMGALPPAERSAFMPMTDARAFPAALKPAWTNNGLSQGMCGSVFLVGKQWKEWEGRLAVGYAGIGIHGTSTGNRIDILDISKDGTASTRQELSWPTFAGRFRHVSMGPDNALYVADEASGMIYRVTPN